MATLLRRNDVICVTSLLTLDDQSTAVVHIATVHFCISQYTVAHFHILLYTSTHDSQTIVVVWCVSCRF